MLYFRFNTDSFKAPKQTVTVTPYINGIPSNETYTEEVEICLGDIETYFFEKLRTELALSEIGMNFALYDVLGVPYDSFGVNDEGNIEGIIKFVLLEYSKLPIQKLDNKSLQDLGITIEFCKKISNKKGELMLNRYMKENNLSYITEDILWKNMTDEEKVEKFSSFFSDISSSGQELIIVDPYLFKDERDEYCNMLASVIKNAQAEKIIAVTECKNYSQSSHDKVTSIVGKEIEVKYSSDFHDRFWIANRQKGFYTGTSFNGVGKRISLINLLSANDVSEIIEELHQKSVI